MTSSKIPSDCVEQSGCRLAGDLDLLRHLPLFAGINLDVVKLFAYLCERRSFRAGDYLIKQDREAKTAFLLIEGAVEITVLHRGREVVLQPLGQGAFFGELALLATFPWFFSAKATTAVEVLVISRTTFQKVIDKYPAQRDKLIERLIQLRVHRLTGQTSFMLDSLSDSNGMPASALL